MFELSELERTIEDYVQKKTSDAARENWEMAVTAGKEAPFNYRLDHVRRVVDLARRIGESEGVDSQVLTLSAWLHDISKPGLNSRGKHGEKSAEIAAQILDEHQVPMEKIGLVQDTITKHVGLTLDRPLDTAEARALWDADKLVKLGAIGIIHYTLNSLILEPGQSSHDFCNAFEEFLPLAERIAESMNTEIGRRLASERLETLRGFIHDLQRELGRGEGDKDG